MIHPTLKKTPKGYFEWLKMEVNREDDIRWAKGPNPSTFRFSFTKESWPLAALHALGKEITSFIRP